MAERPVPTIFSQKRLHMRDARATTLRAKRDHPADWLAATMAEDILDRISFMRFEPKSALVVGRGGGVIAEALKASDTEVATHEGAAPLDPRDLVDAGFDLIVELGRLDTVNDLPGTLVQYRAALAPGGIFMASIVGAGSLSVLRQAMLAADDERPSPRIHPQIDNRVATMLLERAGFARQVVDSHGLSVRYASFDRLIADLREQGLSSALREAPRPIGKAGKSRAQDAFAALAEADGKVSEHFELLTLTGWNS